MRPAARPLYRLQQFWQHITARFSKEEEQFARSLLTRKEWALFEKFPVFEKRHAVDVAKYVEKFQGKLPPAEFRTLQKAALLHDIGKVKSPLNPVQKSLFVLLRLLAPPLIDWLATSGRSPKARVFLQHHLLGAELLKEAGTESKVIQLVGTYQENAPGKLHAFLAEADEQIL